MEILRAAIANQPTPVILRPNFTMTKTSSDILAYK